MKDKINFIKDKIKFTLPSEATPRGPLSRKSLPTK